MVVLHTVRFCTHGRYEREPSRVSAKNPFLSRPIYPNVSSMSIACRFSDHGESIFRLNDLTSRRLSSNRLKALLSRRRESKYRVPARQNDITYTRCKSSDIEIRPAKRQELRRVAEILADVFQAEYCTGLLGWASLRSIRNEIRAELEEQWDDKAMKRFIARGEEDAEPTVATDGKEHVVLIATDRITGEVLGCVEARGMQGYLRPKAIPVISSEDTRGQEVISNSVSPNCEESSEQCKPGFLRDPTALPPRRPPWPYMANLAVIPSARRRGIGNMLVAEAESLVVDWGFRELLLKVETSNVVAMEFYDSLGYNEVYRTEALKLTGDSLFGGTETVEVAYHQRDLALCR
mmetsp:Transcript_7770/g.15888  ORF Transcript_7770/g.15888 Transcript_7770/m.15888 type:complete len:349 (-) Transcript_7770:142-1188(-)|eukprot:CAMPEP_0118936048 /NCGR_PEP_ID=MMETSP1169-20130426/15978_1 /TAXON_ID=36882 /ORGANISM="Pyramimonas obovata, Strain CCMP722" /LENGTH=348 /DNA_ID=CAMNT_0006879147 /DNA_START=57 /DNA_END=1103 /DNA_ORIENTATION=+